MNLIFEKKIYFQVLFLVIISIALFFLGVSAGFATHNYTCNCSNGVEGYLNNGAYTCPAPYTEGCFSTCDQIQVDWCGDGVNDLYIYLDDGHGFCTGTMTAGVSDSCEVSCSPSTQTREEGQSANFSASGGDHDYDWSAPGANPSAGNFPNFSTSWTSSGSKTVTVSAYRFASDSIDSDSCSVTVTEPAAGSLNVSLTATPSSGTTPLSSVLSANVSGTETGTINYNFWYNCTYTGTVLSTANSTCGTLTTPAAGTCVNTAGVGYKCNGVNTDPQSVPSYSYSPANTYTAKVIVERGTAPNAEARATVTVNPVVVGCAAAGTGTGLIGDFYDGINFNTLVSSGITFANLGVSSINFNPADTTLATNRASGPDTYSVRGPGQV